MFRISLCAAMLPAALSARVSSMMAPAAISSSAMRALSSKKSADLDVESDDFTDDDFAWLDEFFDEGLGDAIDFIPEDEARFLAAETKPRTP
ncbi:Hypothetical protein, putative [Bodo saltans]|uniref:Membrane-associated protein n=1 Tax=Bodo saltans TaxID=75058 RepID=A0A0S4IQF3_BODSA|nr:Hypothetical protein, putative [Bodo saltans]|eukprot:CUE73082.1 Hypothetical protein, putative [Bodo saltans]